MSVTSPEAGGSIVRRAEHRRQQIIDTMREAAKITLPLVADNSASPQRAGNTFKEVDLSTKMEQKETSFADGKKNMSPSKRKFTGLYPMKPPRSVYNSPLISKNREPLWKSPPVPYPGFEINPILPKKELISIPNTYNYYYQPPSLSLGKGPVAALPGKENNGLLKLYPSLPRSEVGSPLKKTLEEKYLKEHRNNFITANSGKSSSTPLASPQQSPKKDVKSPLASSTFIENEELPSETRLFATGCEDEILNLNKASFHSIPDEDDIEDTYEMDRFLEDALGSQLDSCSSLPSVATSVQDSTYTLCCYRNLKKSVGSQSALSSASTKCATFPRFQNEGQDSRVERLLLEADRQQQVMMQASKAVNICRSTKAFSNSMHLVDGERVLLLASLRHQAALKEIQSSSEEADFESRGDLQVLDVVAPLKPDYISNMKSIIHDDQWFVCVVSCGEQVVATKAVAFNVGTECLRFPGVLQFSNLPSSFVATVQIYTFRIHVPRESSRRKSIHRVCKLLLVQRKSCLGLAASTEQMQFLRTPAFSLSGTATFSLADIDQLQTNHICLEKVPLMSPLQGSVLIRVKAALVNTLDISGFLDVLEERGSCRAWQRRWCRLSGLSIYFWNYPSDQDIKDPIQVIELRMCVSMSVGPAPRDLCARARTILLQTQRSQSSQDVNSTLMECNLGYTVERHFLSCDSIVEMKEWIHAINQCLSSIQTWKMPHYLI